MTRPWIFVFPGLLFLSATCERTVDLGLEDPDPRLAIVGTFPEGGPLTVEVTKTRSVLADASTEYPLNAVIRLYEDNRFLEQLVLSPPEEGATPFYQTNQFESQAGREYRLEVRVPGFPMAEAASVIPKKVTLDEMEAFQIQALENPENNTVTYQYTLNAAFVDPSPNQQKNYYHLLFFLQLEKTSGILGDTAVQEFRSIVLSSSINTNYQVAHYEGGVLLEDTPFEGEYKWLEFPVTLELPKGLGTPTGVVAALRSVPEEYYRFFSAVNRQRVNPDLPFAEPVILFTNVRNGVGVFSGYSQDFLAARIK
ncbi:MAG: DUF4249 domain-containing protein [Haliscomenobacter sp.]|nr:DUF4249 domain-containing protein [Haliscomenobacter sp.]